MAKRLPVVATAVGGVPEVVDDGVTGELVPSGDVDAIATALIDLGEKPDRRARMAELGYERAQALFTLDETVTRTEQLYREVLEPAP